MYAIRDKKSGMVVGRVTAGDLELVPEYIIVLTNGNDEQEVERKYSEAEAIAFARDFPHDKHDWVEIRFYTDDIDDEDGECFDYDTIDFE